MDTGERLRYLREKKGLKQGFVAEKIGVDNAILSKYESNKRRLDYDRLIKLSELYNVSIDYLVRGKDSKIELRMNLIDLTNIGKLPFGKRLQFLREERDLSITFVAEKIDVGESLLGMYETDKRKPDFNTIKQLSDLYEVSMEYLVKGYEYQGLRKEQSVLLEEFDKLNPEDKELAMMFIKRMSK